MTIALRGTVQATDTDTSSHTAIAGLTAGDVFIDIAHNTGGGAAPTLPGGSYPFTTIGTGTDSAGRNYTYGRRVATGAETGLVTTGFKLADTFFACSGVDNATPVESFQAPGTRPGGTVTRVAASTPTVDNCWHVLIFADTNSAGNTITTPPAGYTQLSFIPVAGQGSVYVYYKDLGPGSAGVSTGTKDATWSAGGGFGIGAGFILRAASGPTTPTASISDVTVTNLSGNAVLTVSLSSAAPVGGVAGLVNTSDITALAGVDYTGETNVPFSIAAGQTSGTITIPITP